MLVHCPYGKISERERLLRQIGGDHNLAQEKFARSLDRKRVQLS